MGKYEAVGVCIYCRSPIYSEADPTHKLGDEHIVPASFGGRIVLPHASCKLHETATSQIEDHCVRHLLHSARPHLKLRGRKSRKVASSGPFMSAVDSGPRKIPAESHPGWMADFTYPYPAFLAGRMPQTQEALIHVRPVVRDFQRRVLRLGGRILIKLPSTQTLLSYARLLAKIAHVFAVAELGIDAFEPWLPGVIFDDPSSPFGIMDLVGTGRADEPPSSDVHEISFAHGLTVFGELVVRVRLFANLDAPSRAHYVVVGKPI